MIAIPVIVIIVAEGALSLAGVGEKYNAPIIAEDGEQGIEVFNPVYASRYFDDFVPSVAFNPFQENKSRDTIRIVVLGGSTTAGFPYQFYFGFPAAMERHLRGANPKGQIEVINLGMTAVNSYTLWDLRNVVVSMDPDLVVIYAGHNEYYGAFGAASSVNPVGNSHAFKRLVLRLKKTALYAGLERVIESASNIGSAKPSSGSSESAADRTLMARVVGSADIELGGATYQKGIDQFADNMGDVLDAFKDHDIPVLIGTLVSNLSGQAPLGDNTSALEAWNTANSSDCQSRGCNRDLYVQALDEDNIRFRAPSK
ncbi:MAG: SGNH/GDSL hydrolase family protein, partial [Bacteroidetes bacterium]|nr:SGNH/GDSL hydrolase family protein [Bacteroidota bacterium]